MKIVIASKSFEETLRIGRIIGKTASSGEVIALVGELGTGKTCLTQGIARGLAVPEAYPITSPTFTLINEYPGKLDLYHFDIYRLEGVKDLEDMGYEDYFYGEGVTVIEWAERSMPLLPAGTLFVYLAYRGENDRELILTGNNELIGKINNLCKEGGC